MASQRKITRYAEYVEEKSQNLLKLRDLYEAELEVEVVAFNSKAEKKILNAQLLKLIAEKEVLEENQIQILPEDPDFLFDWAKHKLKIKIDNLQKSLEKETETKEQLLADERELVNRLAKEKRHNADYDPVKELLEEEKYLYELVQHLHRKIVKRLRRLARLHLSSDSLSNSSVESQRCFYKLLQKFIVELQQPSPSNLSKEDFVIADESMPMEHLQFLLDCDVIEIVNQDPLAFGLKKTIK